MINEIKTTIQNYAQSFYSGDFKETLSYLNKKEIKNYITVIKSFAEKMDVFGESEEFLKLLKIKNLDSLQNISPNKFMLKLLGLMKREIKEKELNKMVKGIKITKITTEEDHATVDYIIPYLSFGKWEKMPSSIQLSLEKEKWKIHFKSGIERSLTSFQKQIDLYYLRKSRDILSNLDHHVNDLEPFSISGYKNMNGDIVFEPRFKDAGKFSEGLAYVQIMNKYGFINKKGDIAIKPQFRDARSFSEKLAAVEMKISDSEFKWGFINSKGVMVIEAIYDGCYAFNEGLCAVVNDSKWGFINKKGVLKIPHQFYEVEDFFMGFADVIYLDKEGNEKEITINKKGKIIDD